MELQRPLFFFFLFTLLSSSQANKFNVGGSQGWVPDPSESYNNWAGRNRFQINDIIVFKYKKDSDSVLEVKKDDYDKCNKTNPIKKFENGDTEFKFDRSGPFYFISGKDGNCEKGQKLIVVVLSPRTPPTPKTPSPPKSSPSPSPSPSPNPNPPTSSPPLLPPSPPPRPPSPSTSPASSPVPSSGPPATTPSPQSPTVGPPATSPAPTVSPATTPPAPGPVTMGPTASPPSPPGPNSPLPTPSTATAPSSKNSGTSVAPSIVLVYFVTLVVGGVMLLRN